MKISRQTKNAYDPDFPSFEFSVRSCARSETLMKRPVRIKIPYDTDLARSSNERLRQTKKIMIQTLSRSCLKNKTLKLHE